MKNPIGRKCWAIAEGYIPPQSHGPAPEMTSHEAVCLLNTTQQEAHVEITIYFSDREACRTLSDQRRAAENEARALQQPGRSGADPARYGLCEHD